MSALTILAGLLFWAVAPTTLGWRAALITSGSMAPGIRPGDLVILVPITAQEVAGSPLTGAVVQFHDPVRRGRLVVHRVVDRDPTGALITRGDANPSRDRTPVQPSQVLGVGRVRVPFVGLPVLWWQNRQPVPLVATGLVLLMLAWPERSRPAASLAASVVGHRRPDLPDADAALRDLEDIAPAARPTPSECPGGAGPRTPG